MKNINIIILIVIALVPVSGFARKVFAIGDGDGDWPEYITAYIESLEAHDCALYYHDILPYSSGRTYFVDTDLEDIDLMWIVSLEWPGGPYPMGLRGDEITAIIEFVQNGGKTLIWAAVDPSVPLFNPLLSDPRWKTTLLVGTEFYPSDVGITPVIYWLEFPPFTNGVRPISLWYALKHECGEHAFPFAFAYSDCTFPVMTISYPFLHEGNCSSFVILVTGTHQFDDGTQWMTDEELTWAVNMLLAAAGAEGYELPPGAIPGGGFVEGCGETVDTISTCFTHPSPFTPNSDGINDFAKFEYPGMHRYAGVVFIYTLENAFVREVKNGEVYDSPKGTIYWDGKDGYGKLMENGVYLYIVQDGVKTVCKGTVYLAR